MGDAEELQKNQWYKSKCNLGNSPLRDGYGFKKAACFADRDNVIHLIQWDNGQHFCASMEQLIPYQVRYNRRAKYMPLVLGYLHAFEADQPNMHIPPSLQRLIAAYF